MKNMEIRKAATKDKTNLISMAKLLWKDSSLEELEKDLFPLSNKTNIFVAYDKTKLVGFAYCSLRYDYVEGTDSSPVAYLEGIYVLEEYRKQGIAKILLDKCFAWARKKSCVEFASDCELSNIDSILVHKKLGFTEVNRIVCFTKKLK